MITIAIPDFGELELRHVVLDYNGTMAIDGVPIDGVLTQLDALAARLDVHVLTADTFGRVREALAGHDIELSILPPDGAQDRAKAEYVEALGAAGVAAFGNGRNDAAMLARAALGVAVLQREGAAAATLLAADVVCPDIGAALELLTNPLRLVATLRR